MGLGFWVRQLLHGRACCCRACCADAYERFGEPCPVGYYASAPDVKFCLVHDQGDRRCAVSGS